MDLLQPEYGIMLWTLFGLGLLGFWLAALISILKSDFRGTNEKLIWVLIVIFLPFLGSILYFTIGKNNRIKHNRY